MEIILKENIAGLGYKNEVVTVKDGYGRNFLIPQGKAVIANKSSKKHLAEILKQQAHKMEKIKADAQAFADKLNALEPLKIEAKVSKTGVTYGSITSAHVVAALKELGFDIDRKSIAMRDAKAVGEYTATVKIHRDVNAVVRFNVVSDEEPEVEAALPEEPAAPAVEEATAEVEEAPAEEATTAEA